MKFSKDIIDEIAAENAIKEIEDAKELQAFIKGEQRESLLDIAAYRLNALKSAFRSPHSEIAKQGEQSEPITQPVQEFKGGIQRTKGADGPVTGDNVIDALDAAAEQKAEAILKQDAVEETAKLNSLNGLNGLNGSNSAKPKAYVTCEDVITRMRAEGKKI